MKRRLAVVGAGTAGLLTATHLCTWLDNTWEVWVLHDPQRKILGIGESTNGAFISVLERGTNFSLAYPEDVAALDATIKYGSKFVGWRPQHWINPLLSGNVAVHFNNVRLKDFVFQRLSQLWTEQFRVLECKLLELQNYTDHVGVVTDQGVLDFDFVVDCTGTPSEFAGYTLSDCTLVDRCLIHTVKDYEYEPYTEHIATPDGWMFGVPLADKKTYGYLYHHGFTDDDSARRQMSKLLGTETLDAGSYDAQYAFRCYYANELISGRIAKNGNKALFFEPLLANSMFLYIYAARLIYDRFLNDRDAAHINGLFTKAVHEVEDVISYYYRGGSTFDTQFWLESARRSVTRLEKRTEFAEYMQKLRGLKQNGTMYSGPPYAFSPHTWHIVDSQMGYGSFTSAASSATA